MLYRVSLFLFFLALAYFSFVPSIFASIIDSDPQYVVMNFSDINELNWAAPEDEWRKDIKPKILSQLHEYKAAIPIGTNGRKRAWSTLMEYMNFPIDNPNENSIYAVKMRRILEITEEEDLPVFIPLNGFQWWDELPELYNWWDPDGSHTPSSFFDRQDDPEGFKKRFVEGYNPNNIWNVEWQNYDIPMSLNYRDWGGGSFRLAPPPNLLRHNRTSLTYRKILEDRLEVIVKELVVKLNMWEKTDKSYLFAGITIGTEISLNASVSPSGFDPYGYRAIQDYLCDQKSPKCGLEKQWSRTQLQKARKEIVASYLLDLSRIANFLGIPKQRIYTHVWGEVKEEEERYEEYAYAAFNLYSRPGMSFYGYAEDPFALPIWNKALQQNGQPSWGAVEYSLKKETNAWNRSLVNIFDSQINPGKIIIIYNWEEHKNTPAISALANALSQEPKRVGCYLPEILPLTKNPFHDPKELMWKFLDKPSTPMEKELRLHFVKGFLVASASAEDFTLPLKVEDSEVAVPSLSPGPYVWYLSLTGCSGKRVQYSEPRIISISAPTEIPVTTKYILFIENFFKEIANRINRYLAWL